MTRSGAALALLAALGALSATGCDGSATPDAASGRAGALWAARTPYVGDNSRVGALVGRVGPAPAGSYTIELHTAAAPLGLTVDLTRLDKPFPATDFHQPAALLLGLIGNADEVTFTSGGDTYSLTAAQASRDVGFDVRRLGQDRGALEAYVRQSTD